MKTDKFSELNEPFTNKLIHQSSPYLQEHAHNPVHWYPWGEEALQKAEKEHKPLIISIGYASCHWCHVMEKQSYSDTEVADFMNEHFVAIKVDREERPDIDQIYMNASMLLNGNGGWPLNAFALPNGKPFYVLTYLPKDRWLVLLQQIVKVFKNQQKDVAEQAESITQGIATHQLIHKPKEEQKEDLKGLYNSLFQKIITTVDLKDGGFNRSPKFPLPVAWEWMLQEYDLNANDEALEAVEITLNQMAKGGIYDQIGGGFSRYSTDGKWRVPHFEKMLYDNGQLVSLYAKAFQISNNPAYEKIIRETLAFVKREMIDGSGGFYSSINADSEGDEGKFYVWSENEIREVLPPKTADLIISYYHIQTEGNWEDGKNILFHSESEKGFAQEHGLEENEWEKMLEEAKQLLFERREKRMRPTTDDKILVSWNALMLKGYIHAYQALGDDVYLQTALDNASFIAQNMMQEDGRLFRNFMNKQSSIDGLLEDYALLADAYIALYQVTFEKYWLDLAEKLTEYVLKSFQDTENPLFYYTSDKSESLIVRKKELEDNVIPASNSVMARVLFALGHYFDRERYIQKAKEMLLHVKEEIPSAVPYFANWAQLLGLFSHGISEVAVVGEDALLKSKSLQQQYSFSSNLFFLGGNEENLPLLENKKVSGKTMIYVCKNKVCKQPVHKISQALKQIKYLAL